MPSFLRDVRRAARFLGRTPVFFTVAVLTLAVSIGASTAVYTLVERVVIDPLPFSEPDRLVRLTSETSEGMWQISRAQYAFFRDHSRTVDRLAGFRFSEATIRGAGEPERLGLALATSSLFPLLGVGPVAGRLFDSSDDPPGAPVVALLSYGYWQRAFGGEPSVVGKTLRIDEHPVEVVGVLPRGMALPDHVEPGQRPDVWIPLQPNLRGEFWNSHMEFRTIARLAPGATEADARRELGGFNPQLMDTYPGVYPRTFMDTYHFRTTATPLKQAIVGEVAGELWILLAGVGLVLLIAAANIANLFLVRGEARRRELAVRTAVGAGRGALFGLFLAEATVVTGLGTALGLLLASPAATWLAEAAPARVPRLDHVGLDASVTAVAMALGLLVVVPLSVFPWLRHGRNPAPRPDLADGGRSSTPGRERQHARGALLVTQVALALVLLVSATLLLQSFHRLRTVDPGIRPDGVLTLPLALPAARYGDKTRQWNFYQAVLQRVRAMPEVVSAGAGGATPFGDGYGCTAQAFGDQEVMRRVAESNNTLCAGQISVTPGYFEALGIPVIEGRAFSDTDDENPALGSVVVSRAFARRFWPGEDPLGQTVAPSGRTQGPFYRVVGLVGDVFPTAPSDPPAAAIYYPVVPIPPSGGLWGIGMDLVVQTRLSDPLTLFPRIRDAVREVDPAIAVSNPRTMDQVVAASMSGVSFVSALLGIAAAAALLLAALGLYGVVSYTVSRRTSELGLRIALGAPPADVERMVVRGSFGLTAAGLLLGALAAAALTRYLRALLFGVQPLDPVAFASAAAALSVVALLAAWLPARRAARVDPIEALRTE